MYKNRLSQQPRICYIQNVQVLGKSEARSYQGSQHGVVHRVLVDVDLSASQPLKAPLARRNTSPPCKWEVTKQDEISSRLHGEQHWKQGVKPADAPAWLAGVK
jgi:hypothetical protein